MDQDEKQELIDLTFKIVNKFHANHKAFSKLNKAQVQEMTRTELRVAGYHTEPCKGCHGKLVRGG